MNAESCAPAGKTSGVLASIAGQSVVRLMVNAKIAGAYYNCGTSHLQQGCYDEAIADYTKAIELHPKHMLAYNGRGTAYERKGDKARAVADFHQALVLNPNLKQAEDAPA